MSTMAFRITVEQADVRDGIAAWAAGEHGPDRVRRTAEAGVPDSAVGDALVGIGLPGLLVPEPLGGLGLGLVEAALVAIEFGRACLSHPIVGTALVAAPWLARHGFDERLADVARGTATIAFAHRCNPWVEDLAGAGWLIDGSDVRRADGLAQGRLDSIDPLRRLWAFETDSEDDDLCDIAALIDAAQLLGLAEGMLAMARDYALARVQFGKTIGSFQAIKHHLADIALKIEFARPVLLRAADALQQRDGLAGIHVSHAKLACGDAATIAGERAIQIHGAMGYTYEVDLHFWMKRSWALTGAWGNRAFHIGRIEQAILDGTIPIGPDHSFVREHHHG